MASGGPTGGYQKQMFGEHDVELHICGVCTHVLMDPVQASCGHRFCMACIDTEICTKDRPTCPSCQSEDKVTLLSADEIHPDMGAKRDLFKLEVTKCTLCEWSGTYKELDQYHWAKHTEQLTKKANDQQPAQDNNTDRVIALELQVQELMIESFQQRKLLEHIAMYTDTPGPNIHGTYLWKIENYERQKQRAVDGFANKLISLPFYTSQYGYKMQASIYLNGEGLAKGTHLSIFLVICKGDFDALLQWPFKQKVTLKLFNQNGGQHIMESFSPDTNSPSFKRPTTAQNIGSGMSRFAPLYLVESDYVRDDTIFVLIKVDCSGLQDQANT